MSILKVRNKTTNQWEEIQAIKGEQGDTGVGITSITKTGTSGYVDTYTITFSDGTTSTYEVTNGEVSEEDLEQRLYDNTQMLYNALPTTSGNGEEITLDGTAEVPFRKIDLKGNTYQYSTTGKNLCSLNNTTSIGGITFTKLDNGKLKLTGTSTSDVYMNVGVASLKIDTDYTLSCPQTQSNVMQPYLNGSVVSGSGWVSTTTKKTNFRVGETKNYNVAVYIKNGVTLNTEIELQLEEGNEKTSFEPYTGNQPSPSPDYPQDIQVVSGDNTIKVEGKNLLDTSNARTDKTWLTRNNDGTITINYPNGSNVNFTTLFENNINIPTGNYKLKIFMTGTYVGGNLIVKDTNNNNIVQAGIVNGNILTITNSDIGNIQFYVLSAGTNCTIGLELEKGTTEPTSYQAYQTPQTYPINIGNIELCKIGDYQDKIYKDSGKWYLHKEIGKVVLDGSENWKLDNVYNNINQYSIEKPDAYDYNNNITKILSNHFKGYQYSASWTIDNSITISNSNYIGRIRAMTSLYTTVEDFKTWLSTHNTTCYYVLATPTTTEITDTTLISQLEALKNAYSYDAQTNISQTNEDKPFIIDAEAILNMKYLFNDLETRIAVLETE